MHAKNGVDVGDVGFVHGELVAGLEERADIGDDDERDGDIREMALASVRGGAHLVLGQRPSLCGAAEMEVKCELFLADL